jgi:hypothetical protein
VYNLNNRTASKKKNRIRCVTGSKQYNKPHFNIINSQFPVDLNFIFAASSHKQFHVLTIYDVMILCTIVVTVLADADILQVSSLFVVATNCLCGSLRSTWMHPKLKQNSSLTFKNCIP